MQGRCAKQSQTVCKLSRMLGISDNDWNKLDFFFFMLALSSFGIGLRWERFGLWLGLS